MRKLALAAALLLTASPVFPHVTPNVELMKKAEFIRQSLPAATKFSEQRLSLSEPDLGAVRKATGWTPSEEEAKLYVGRDEQGGLLGRVVMLWIPSQHGPVGLAVAFDPAGKILRVAVTDIGSEPLAWIRPLLDRNGLAAFAGLPAGATLDPARIAPEVTGTMSRYFARVIADGVGRAQALERLAMAPR